ncbi:hypothetical protein ABPG72_005513 [Tetrahymena utriculariae]
MKILSLFLAFSLFVCLSRAQVRQQFQNCLKNNCNNQLLACQNASASCTSDMKSFSQCQSTASICNSQSVPDEEFHKAINNCIDFCSVSGSTQQFKDYLSCAKQCFSEKLALISSLLLVLMSILYF